MMDGGPVTDQTVYRAAIISRICEGFSCLPSAAERELDHDPDQLALLILDLRGYMAAKRAFDDARDKVDSLKSWTGNPYMTMVETVTCEDRAARAEGNGGR